MTTDSFAGFPLREVVVAGERKRVDELLMGEANVDPRDNAGRIALYLACETDNAEMVTLILIAHPIRERRDVMLRQPLFILLITLVALSMAGCSPRASVKPSCEMHYPNFDYTKYRTVAVVGNCTEINTELEKMLVTYAKSPYRVIERSRLEVILKEHGLGVAGVLDAQSVTRMGKIPGVDALAITECSGDYVSMRFVDSTTGEVLAVYNEFKQWTYANDLYEIIGPWKSGLCP